MPNCMRCTSSTTVDKSPIKGAVRPFPTPKLPLRSKTIVYNESCTSLSSGLCHHFRKNTSKEFARRIFRILDIIYLFDLSLFFSIWLMLKRIAVAALHHHIRSEIITYSPIRKETQLTLVMMELFIQSRRISGIMNSPKSF